MRKLLEYIWQLPQNLCGILYRDYMAQHDNVEYIHATDRYTVYRHGLGGSVTLGRYIFLGRKAGSIVLQHESGHARQSLYLGPLYLLIIGLPSLLWASIYKPLKIKVSYYWFYTEAWANKLAHLKLKSNC